MYTNKRSSWTRADPGLMVTLLVATLAAWPLLSRASLPTLTDAHHHIYRTYEILAAWREGILYPRWAPDFYFGFGYPLLNYYSTLTYYLAAAYGWFFGPVAGVKFCLVLAAYLGTVGVYLFGRDQWGPAAGVLGAAVYSFAPYIVLTDPIQRGALPEAFAIALAPLVLWSFTRLARTGSVGYFLLSALLLAALVIAHNLMSFVFIGLLGGWLVWDLLLIHKPGRRVSYARVFGLLAGAGLLALALTAFMWLPAAFERSAVQFQQAFVTVQKQRFLTLGQLFLPMTTSDVQTFNAPDFPFRLGWPQWILALLGGLTLLRPTPHRRASIFFLLVSLACLWIMVPQSSWLWDHASLLPYLQFSFRLLGAASLCLAWLAGAALDWARLARLSIGRNGLAALLTTVVIFAGLPLLNPLPWAEFGTVNPKAILELDLYGLWGVGTTWAGEFLPVTVKARPQPVPAMLDAITAGGREKVDRTALAPGTTVQPTTHDSASEEFKISAASGFVLRLYTFDWPGWTAHVDGVKTAIQVVEPQGWISVAMPPGDHVIKLQLEDTGPRQLGWALSGAGLMVALITAGAALLARRQRAAASLSAVHLPPRTAGFLASMAVLAILTRAELDLGIRWQASHVIPTVAAAQVQHYARFDDGMALVAFDFPQATARPGGQVPLKIYWEATQAIWEPASVFVHFYGPNGQLWGQSDQPDPIALFPTTRWSLGKPLADSLTAAIRPDAPPGTYSVAVGLWSRATGARSHLLGENGQPNDQDKVILTDHFQVEP